MILARRQTSSVLAAPMFERTIGPDPGSRLRRDSIRLRGVADVCEITVGNFPDEIWVEEVQ